jgi:hypothetical protein
VTLIFKIACIIRFRHTSGYSLSKLNLASWNHHRPVNPSLSSLAMLWTSERDFLIQAQDIVIYALWLDRTAECLLLHTCILHGQVNAYQLSIQN